MSGNDLWWYVFVLGFLVTGLGETFLPRYRLRSSTLRRWTSNFVLFAFSFATLAVAFQLTAVALAFTVRGASHGVLNRTSLPYSLQFLLGFALLDLTAYLSHRFFHAVALLWRVHQVHHAETDLDLTTGFRFHPFESLISQGLVLVTIALFGPPPGAVALLAVAILLQDFVQHANCRFPETIDRVLRLVFVTPAMHHLHHSVVISQQNTNFGTVFSVWDRLFGSFRVSRDSEAGEPRFGLAEFADGSQMSAARLLWLPFQHAREVTAPADTRTAPYAALPDSRQS